MANNQLCLALICLTLAFAFGNNAQNDVAIKRAKVLAGSSAIEAENRISAIKQKVLARHRNKKTGLPPVVFAGVDSLPPTARTPEYKPNTVWQYRLDELDKEVSSQVQDGTAFVQISAPPWGLGGPHSAPPPGPGTPQAVLDYASYVQMAPPPVGGRPPTEGTAGVPQVYLPNPEPPVLLSGTISSAAGHPFPPGRPPSEGGVVPQAFQRIKDWFGGSNKVEPTRIPAADGSYAEFPLVSESRSEETLVLLGGTISSAAGHPFPPGRPPTEGGRPQVNLPNPEPPVLLSGTISSAAGHPFPPGRPPTEGGRPQVNLPDPEPPVLLSGTISSAAGHPFPPGRPPTEGGTPQVNFPNPEPPVLLGGTVISADGRPFRPGRPPGEGVVPQAFQRKKTQFGASKVEATRVPRADGSYADLPRVSKSRPEETLVLLGGTISSSGSPHFPSPGEGGGHPQIALPSPESPPQVNKMRHEDSLVLLGGTISSSGSPHFPPPGEGGGHPQVGAPRVYKVRHEDTLVLLGGTIASAPGQHFPPSEGGGHHQGITSEEVQPNPVPPETTRVPKTEISL